MTAPTFRRELIALIVPRRWLHNLQQREQDQLSMTNRIYPSTVAGKSVNFQIKSIEMNYNQA